MGGVSDGNSNGRLLPSSHAAAAAAMGSVSDEKQGESTEARQRKRAANQGAGKAEEGEEHRGEAEEARRDSGERKNGNPAPGFSPLYLLKIHMAPITRTDQKPDLPWLKEALKEQEGK